MKRTVALSLIVVSSLAACSSDPADEPGDSSDATAQTDETTGSDTATDDTGDMTTGQPSADQLGIVATENVIDIPGRCPSDQNAVPTFLYGAAVPGFLDGAFPYQRLLEYAFVEQDLHINPSPFMTFILHDLDYYGDPASLRDRIEQILEDTPEARQADAHGNYASFLAYAGEFELVVELFTGEGQFAEYLEEVPEIAFILGIVELRLGHYEQAVAHATDAVERLPASSPLDALWIQMLAEMGLWGDDFFDRTEIEISAIEATWPERDWDRMPFEDVTDELGFQRWGGTGGVAWLDLDGDGWDDLVTEQKWYPYNVYRNIDGERFEAVPQEDLGNNDCHTVVTVVGDVDNDGDKDIFRHGSNFNGPGPRYMLEQVEPWVWEDVTEGSGLEKRSEFVGAGMMTAFGDHDLDGDLDLIVGDNVGPSQFFVNNGDGTWTNATESAGVVLPGSQARDGIVGVAFGDFDGDRYPDIFGQGLFWRRLLHNNQDGTFTDVTEEMGLDLGEDEHGYMCFFFDYNADGLLDIYAGTFVSPVDASYGLASSSLSTFTSPGGPTEDDWSRAAHIYENNGDGTFTDIWEQNRFVPLGSMGANYGDWNNDGYPDIARGTGGPFLHLIEPFLWHENNGDGTFDMVSPFHYLSLWGKGHGSAFSDYDHDGDLDMIVINGGFHMGDIWPSMILRNTGNDNHWVDIRLAAGNEGTNADAMGARVLVETANLTQIQELWTSGRFNAANSMNLHFGLGGDDTIERITVEWPNAALNTTVLTNIDADQAIEIRETDGSWEHLW